MKTRRVVIGIVASAILVLLAVLLAAGITKLIDSTRRDIVAEVTASSTELEEDARIIQRELSLRDPTQARDFMQQKYPRLGGDVVYLQRQLKSIRPEEQVQSVELYFGSMKKAKTIDRESKVHEGRFRDQLLARINISGREVPLSVLVQNMNEVIAPERSFTDLISLGSMTPNEKFTIGEREGLVHHVSIWLAVQLAKVHGLELYRGKVHVPDGLRISTREALANRHLTDELQITVRVYPGDQFDLVKGEFIPSSLHNRLLNLKAAARK